MGKFIFAVLFLFQQQVFAVKDGHAVNAQNPMEVKMAQTTVQVIGFTHHENGDAELCTGTLIGETYVLTAAHCFLNDGDENYDPNDTMANVSLLSVDGKKVETVDSEKVFVQAQAKELMMAMDAEQPSITNEMSFAQTYKDYVTIEKFFDKHYATPDLAIIKLKTPFSKPHQIAKIYTSVLKINDQVTFAGYGDMIFNDQSDDLDKPLQLTTLRVRELQNLGAKLSSDDGSQIMVGDSGGPGYIVKNNELYVAVTSSSVHFYVDEQAWVQMHTGAISITDGKSVATMMNLSKFKDFINLYIDKGL